MDGFEIETEQDAFEAFWKKPYFAFLDVLGFKNLVKKNSHSELVKIYMQVLMTPVEIYGKYYQNQQKAKEIKLSEYFTYTGLKYLNVSDSILLWTDNCKEQSLIDILNAVKFLMSTSLSLGVPLRGAIVMGDVEVIEKNGNLSLIGAGLVHAYELEGEQEWSGCIISNSIFSYLKSFQTKVMKNNSPLHVEKIPSLIVEYDVPLKVDKSRRAYVVNWAESLTLTEEEIRELFAKHNKGNDNTETKMLNTIQFYNTIQQRI